MRRVCRMNYSKCTKQPEYTGESQSCCTISEYKNVYIFISNSPKFLELMCLQKGVSEL